MCSSFRMRLEFSRWKWVGFVVVMILEGVIFRCFGFVSRLLVILKYEFVCILLFLASLSAFVVTSCFYRCFGR